MGYFFSAWCFPLSSSVMVRRAKSIFPQRVFTPRGLVTSLLWSMALASLHWLTQPSPQCSFFCSLSFSSFPFLLFLVLLCFFFLCFIFYLFIFLLFVLSTSPFFSCVNFQVPLIIIVPHPGAPHLPLLPLPMTATSYHGNHMKLQGDSLGLHIVPVWPIPPPLGRWREPRRAPPQHTSLSTAPSARHTRLRTPFSPHPPAPWGTSGALNSTSAQLDLLRSQDLRGTGSHCLAGPHSPGSGMGRGKQGDSCSLNTDPQRYAPLWWTLQNA